MLRVIPFPPPPRSMVQTDRMNGHHPLHTPSAPAANTQKAPHQQHPLATPATVARVYRTCTNLFLTRRLPDALATLQPIIADSVSPRVKCSRALRTKVWSLYFAILDAAAKMGAEEGKKVWGAAEWRKILQRVRSGAMWDEAIATYGGEGRVDAEVVNALVTLLLAHSQDQSVTQKKIEAYLSAAPNTIGTDDDPKGISQRVKLVELYILHVIPRVGDWDYAREFTNTSPDLDDEQKDLFQATLDQLQKDSEEAERYSQELAARREAQWEHDRQQELADEAMSVHSPAPSIAGSRAGSVATTTRRTSTTTVRPPRREGKRKTASVNGATKEGKVTANNGKVTATTKADSKNLFATTTALLNRLQAQMNTAQGRFTLLRTVIMLAMVVWMTSKRRVRERVRRLLLLAWIKTTRTVGMGMKVTYI